jgi:LCP family protein required for cell wall assembly
VKHLAIVSENPDEHLRAAEIDADRFGAGRPAHRGKAGFGEAMGQYYRVMASGDPDRPDRPEYNVYRAGSGGRGRWRRDKQPASDAGKESTPEKQAGAAKPSGPPEQGSGYKVYKARRGFKRPSTPDLGSLRGKFGRGGGSRGSTPGEKPLWRRIAKYALLALGAWLLLSAVLFVVSSQIQKGKLDDAAGKELGGFPLLVASPQTILVMGTDARPEGSDEAGAETDPKCLEAAATGGATANICASPSRADTLMLVRAGGGAFEKLSIPRDTLAEIPGQDAQKINAAYAFGGAALQVKTVENFLGIDIDHVVILDFEGFADFIDAVGGVTVDLPKRVKSKISGGSSNGGLTLKLDQGENTLDGQEALGLARTRENLRDPSEGDPERAQRQQLILAGIQDRLTSPTRLPYNLIHAPWIAWNAPKAMVSDMGGFTLPQLAMAAAIGGDSGTKFLKPSGVGDGGALVVSQRQCEKAVKDFLGEAGPHQPACSPG